MGVVKKVFLAEVTHCINVMPMHVVAKSNKTETTNSLCANSFVGM